MPPVVTILPVSITAGAIAIVLLWPRVRQGPNALRLAFEVLATSVLIGAVLWGALVLSSRLNW